MTPRPIEIIGGGLAGLSLGLALRRAGVDVTILEAGSYPRHRVCGEFITGLPARTRQSLGLGAMLQDAVPNREVAWFARDRALRRQWLPEPAPSLSRYTLDARLAEAFEDAGGHLLIRTRGPTDGDEPGRVFATGRRRASAPWLGLKFHVPSLPLAAGLELHLGDEAYVGLARIERGRTNVCGLFRRRELAGGRVDLMLSYLRGAGLGPLAGRLQRAGIEADSFCAVSGFAFDHRPARSPEVRLGDASALIPPFTGHGMAMALQGAELALPALLAFARHEATWDRTRTRIQSALRNRFGFRLIAAGLLHTFLLRPSRQRWLRRLSEAKLLPLQPLYVALHGGA